MTGSERREEIIELLKEVKRPIAARVLAEKFGVSRQVIVQDMVVLRAADYDVMATNRGYVIHVEAEHCEREFKVRHGEDKMEEELYLIVDCGGTVKNVSISHRAYGRITAQMNISSRQDATDFINRMKNSRSKHLGNATSEYHYHLVEAPNIERLDLIEQKLSESGFLVPFLPWESQEAEA